MPLGAFASTPAAVAGPVGACEPSACFCPDRGLALVERVSQGAGDQEDDPAQNGIGVRFKDRTPRPFADGGSKYPGGPDLPPLIAPPLFE